MTNQQAIEHAVELLKNSRHAIAITGAGVSTESGIPDFRSSSGLWTRYDPMEYGTLSAFQKDPKKVWVMLKELISLLDKSPNKGHKAMAWLEKKGILKGVITQNIDCLHQKAGSSNVVELHGAVDFFTCPACSDRYSIDWVLQNDIPPCCHSCGNILKPDIIFFGEQLPENALNEAYEILHRADVLIVAGTSCQVMPVASFPSMVHARGGRIIEINLQPVLTGFAEISINEKFSAVMQDIQSMMDK